MNRDRCLHLKVTEEGNMEFLNILTIINLVVGCLNLLILIGLAGTVAKMLQYLAGTEEPNEEAMPTNNRQLLDLPTGQPRPIRPHQKIYRSRSKPPTRNNTRFPGQSNYLEHESYRKPNPRSSG